MEKNSRPVFLNLLQISFPATAILSILHRISGVALSLLLPLFLYLFERSLHGADSFQQLLDLWEDPLSRFIAIIVCWTLIHHLISGARILLLDIGVGIEKDSASDGAIVVSGLSMLALVLVGWALF
ncbi:MAG: succinate dehydrogenase, cytochrome b556 subunit [Gammaproteobacteria bacterium]|uniref:Succinate dehydrogenase cytochrome b556 subunit n=1 Tax=Candidatus Thiopontia autotrophica TaxID=2841688 RepID=A0A8J6NXJ9_9GAMM|nr:succinate dehydrogenase, cytochrome b556 subunit [Candidatus Thiopontia autotrophica]MBL6968960.1 succinate dehydrogenase, cytochrome b556 subunit [Gammaproteobacteria bacterium]